MGEICDLAFIDLETGGLETHQPIVEIAIQRIDPKTMSKKASFHRYVMPPDGHIPDAAAKINGYSESLWKERGAHSIGTTLGEIKESEILVGATPAGQNPAFDMGFLRAWWSQCRGEPFPKMDYHLIDVAVLAWPLVISGDIPGVSLRHTVKFFALGEQRHSALSDVNQTIAVYEKLMSVLSFGLRTER